MRHKNGALYRAFVGVGNTDEQRNSNNARGAGRRALALLLAFMLCVSFVPMGALASGPPYNLAEEFTLTNGATLVDGEYAAQFNQLPNGEGPDPLLAALASFDCSDKVFLLEPAGFPREQLGQLCIFTYSLSSPSLFRLLDALGGTGITIVPYMQEGGVPDHCRVLPLRSLKGGHAHG